MHSGVEEVERPTKLKHIAAHAALITLKASVLYKKRFLFPPAKQSHTSQVLCPVCGNITRAQALARENAQVAQTALLFCQSCSLVVHLADVPGNRDACAC